MTVVSEMGNGIHRAGGFSVTWVDTEGATHNDEAQMTSRGLVSWHRPANCASVVEVIAVGGGGSDPGSESFGEGTLRKVYDALSRAGLNRRQATDAISDMQNQGILFREAT